jgi:hypothetical protein
MRKLVTINIILILLLVACKTQAQSYFTINEYGFNIGASQYFGDLNENYGFKTLSPAYGAYLRRRMNSYIALKLVANYTNVGYDDKYNKIPYQVQRNLNFKSVIYEAAIQAEFNFFKFVTGDPYHRFTPYLTGGVGAFYYNPTTTYKGIKYDLKPLGTEGQNAGYPERKYSNFAAMFPIGAGVKYWLKAGINVSFEISDRFTTTDYLDDVSTTYVGADKFPKLTVADPSVALQDRSTEVGGILGKAGKQRGNSSNKDQYVMATFSISFNFTTYRCPQALDNDYIKTY